MGRLTVLFGALAFAACGSRGGSASPSASAVRVPAPEAPCPAGEAAEDDGRCEPAGIPPASCATGFRPDGDAGCAPILPVSPCVAGQIAFLGEMACHDLDDCGAAPWGDDAIDPSATYVDAAYAAGASDGSPAHPFASIGAAIAHAPSGGTIRVAAGTYAESVQIAHRSARIVGRCASQVTIAAAGAGTALALLDAAGSTVSHVGLRGAVGLAADGSDDVAIDHVWVHDAKTTGISVGQDAPSARFGARVVLVSDVHGGGGHGGDLGGSFGVAVFGGDATFEDVVVRDVTDAPLSIGFRTRSLTAPAAITVRGAVVDHCTNIGFESDVGSDFSLERAAISGVDGGITSGAGQLRQVAMTISTAGLGELSPVGGVPGAVTMLDVDGLTIDYAPTGACGTAISFGTSVAATLRHVAIHRASCIGLGIVGGDVNIDATSLLVEVSPSPGDVGRPILLEGNPSSLTIHGAVLRGAVGPALLVRGTSGGRATRLEGIDVSGGAPGRDELAGDGIMIIADGGRDIEIVGSAIRGVSRAGLSAFGAARMRVGSTTFDDAVIDLDAEALLAAYPSFVDVGGNTCRTSGVAHPCQLQSSGFRAPAGD